MNGILTHDWAFVVMLLECVKQCGCKTKVAFHELVIILWAVYTCKIKDEVTFLAPCVKLLWRRIKVVLEYFLYLQVDEFGVHMPGAYGVLVAGYKTQKALIENL